MRLVLLSLILIPVTAVAQDKLHGFYANGKAGAGNAFAEDASFGLSFEAGYVRNKNLYTAAYLRSEEFDNREVIHCFDLTLGKFIQIRSLIYHYQAGLGAVWGKNERGIDEPFTTIGLPLKTGVKFVPPNFFSIGLDLQANINAEKSMYFAMFTIGIWPRNNP